MDQRPPEPARRTGLRWAWILAVAVCVYLIGAALIIAPEFVLAVLPWRVRYFLERWTQWTVLLVVVVVVGRRTVVTLRDPVPPDRRDVVALLICVAVGIFLFTLPDLIWRDRTGDWIWVGDDDDVLYLAVASQAYFNHPYRLADPARAEGGGALYSWIPCVPGILLARLFGLGPIGVGLAWRVLAGVSIPVAWYLLLRRHVGSALVAGAVVILLTADTGAMFGMPLRYQYQLFRQVRGGGVHWLLMAFRPAGVQWRVTTPGLIFLFLAVYLALLLRARARADRRSIVAAGAAFGTLFYVYFYYWTAAALGLGIGMLLDAGRRRVYLHTAWIGVLIGMPALVLGVLFRETSSEPLIRFNLFLPVARLGAINLSPQEMGLLAACLGWVWTTRRDLLPVGTFALAGWLLLNEQVVTGLQIQNDHWRLHTIGPSLTILMVLAALPALEWLVSSWPRLGLSALFLICGFDLSAGLALRAVEATATLAPEKKRLVQARYRAQRQASGAPRLAPNAVVGGDERFVDWAMILDNQRMLYSDFLIRHSMTVGHHEWNERAALNGTLCGQSRSTFELIQRDRIARDFWGPWHEHESERRRLLDQRMAAYDAVAADLSGALDRYRVRYVGLPSGKSPPRDKADSWVLLERGGFWWVWERCAEPGRVPPHRPVRSAPGTRTDRRSQAERTTSPNRR